MEIAACVLPEAFPTVASIHIIKTLTLREMKLGMDLDGRNDLVAPKTDDFQGLKES